MSVPSSNQQGALAAAMAEALRDGWAEAPPGYYPQPEHVANVCAAVAAEERDALRAQLQAVKDLHQRRDRDGDGFTISLCRECRFNWPCPTVRAIDDPASAVGVGAAQTRTEET